MKESNVIAEKSFKFAVRIIKLHKFLNEEKKEYNLSNRIIKLHKFLNEEKKEYNLSKQLLRSGTSIGANVEEAIGGRTKKEFINLLTIAYKEARETKFWLKLLKECNFIKEKMFESIYSDCEELNKILSRIITTSKKNIE